jgi:hypothetical protein
MLALTINIPAAAHADSGKSDSRGEFVPTSEKLGLQAHVIEGIDSLIVVGLDLSCRAKLAHELPSLDTRESEVRIS